MRDRREYKTISGNEWYQMLRAAGMGLMRSNEAQVQDELFNGLGGEGWEVCAYSQVLWLHITVVLKRRIEPT